EHARFAAPYFVGGVSTAAQLRAVDDVVVKERGGVNELDDGGSLGVTQVLGAASARDHDDDEWTQALAACTNDVFGDLIDQDHVAGKTLPNDTINLLQVVADQRFDGLEAHQERSIGTGSKRHGNGCRVGATPFWATVTNWSQWAR